jgi:Transposase domain (DUF772)
MSQWLDEHCDLLSVVARDLYRGGIKATGRQGLPAEAVLRCAILKQYRQLSYQELAFRLEDSASSRAFARLPWSWSPQKSVLQKTIRAIRPPCQAFLNEFNEAVGEGKLVRWQRFLNLRDQLLESVQLPSESYRYIFSSPQHMSQPLLRCVLLLTSLGTALLLRLEQTSCVVTAET